VGNKKKKKDVRWGRRQKEEVEKEKVFGKKRLCKGELSGGG
jgi:hypothetical protein